MSNCNELKPSREAEVAICCECSNLPDDKYCSEHEEERKDREDPTGMKRFTKVFANEMDRLTMSIRELTKEIKDLKNYLHSHNNKSIGSIIHFFLHSFPMYTGFLFIFLHLLCRRWRWSKWRMFLNIRCWKCSNKHDGKHEPKKQIR